MKLNKQLSTTQFILVCFLILTTGLIFLGGIYYILNIQYQKPRNLFSSGPITTPPKSLRLDLDQPDNDTLSFQSSIIISGQTASSSDVLVSTDTQDLVIKAKTDGSFSTVLNLDEGLNRITAVVFDATGESRQAERTVYFSKEKL